MKAKVLTIILIGSLAILVVSMCLIAATPGNPGQGKKPDREKPVPATNVKVVKKISLRRHGGPPSHARRGKGKKSSGAATGVLGVPVSGSRYAVVVGISEHPVPGMDLGWSHQDAIEMADALITVYHFDDVTLLTDTSATRSAIVGAIEDIPTDAEEVVFFFSGHGVEGDAQDWDKEKIDEGIVVHEDSDISYIWDGELQVLFDRFDAFQRVIFIFDTCLAGGMKKDLRRQGRIIAAATTEKGLAWEDDDLENGEFSYYFVDQGMLQGYANIHDYDGNRQTGEPDQVTVEEAFDYAEANCVDDRPNIGDFFEDDLLL